MGATVEQLTRPPDDNYYEELVERYKSVRRFLPTLLRPVEVMADTAGVSDVVFGLFWLLGYQFSPRLADIGEARFWRLDPQEQTSVHAGAGD